MKKSTTIFLFLDVLILVLSFLFFTWIKRPDFHYYLREYLEPFLTFAILWTGSSVIFGKYAFLKKHNLSDYLYPAIFCDMYILGVVAVLIYGLGRFHYSRLMVFGTTLLSSFLEANLLVAFYYQRKLEDDSDRLEALEKLSLPEEPVIEMPVNDIGITETFENSGLQPFVLENYHEQITEECGERTYEFIRVNLSQANLYGIVVSTTTRFNIDVLPPLGLNLIINLKRINDIQRINKFFESVNRKLPFGGIFIDCVETNEIRKERIMKHLLPGISHVVNFFNYVFLRLLPKLPLTKNLYFEISKGYDRTLSKAEAFGRLYSCGFRVIAFQRIGDRLFFISRKTREPFYDENPTYGPLISLNRIGKNGKSIRVYKVRTMHPYAEYLQEYIHVHNSLDAGGKFKDDFRVSTAGRVFRKYWIDELPMLINLLLGDLKLVGVRPLSRQYFSLYTPELRELRTRYRPGLIPPYYADMPETLEQIMESERKYLLAYERHPFKTDWIYFWKAVRNIVFRHARSK